MSYVVPYDSMATLACVAARYSGLHWGGRRLLFLRVGCEREDRHGKQSQQGCSLARLSGVQAENIISRFRDDAGEERSYVHESTTERG